MVLTAAHCTHLDDKGMPFNASEGKIISEGLKKFLLLILLWSFQYSSKIDSIHLQSFLDKDLDTLFYNSSTLHLTPAIEIIGNAFQKLAIL